MADRIENVSQIPPILDGDANKAQRVNAVPEYYNPIPRLSPEIKSIIDRILLNLTAVRSDLKALGALGFLTSGDFNGLIVMSDAELATLNQLLAGNVIQRLEDLENP